MNFDEKKKSNVGLKIVIGILAALLISSLGYIYKLSTEVKAVKSQLVIAKSGKETVMADLKELITTYDIAIKEKTSMSDELIAERDKVVKLMSDIKKSKGDVSSMAKYKTEYAKLQGNMKVLMAENDGLKKQNKILITQRDSTVAILSRSKKSNENLSGKNKELAKTVEKAAKLTVLNLRTTAYKVKNSGKQIETDKASRTDLLKISFTIAENQVAKSGDKQYYIQVIDNKNNVLGYQKTQTFGDNTLTYSFVTNVKFDHQSVQVSEDLPSSDFEKGTYFVNVFDDDVLVSKASFDLK